MDEKYLLLRLNGLEAQGDAILRRQAAICKLIVCVHNGDRKGGNKAITSMTKALDIYSEKLEKMVKEYENGDNN